MNAPIALVGASAVVAATIALNPAVRPDIHVPALPIHASVQLAALVNPLAVLGQVLQTQLQNIGTLAGEVAANPAPILSNIITNELSNTTQLAGIGQQFLSNVVTTLVNDVPQQISMGLGQIGQGQITNGLNTLAGVILTVLGGENLSNLILIQQLPTILRNPFQNVLNLVDQSANILSDVALAPVQVLSNVIQGVGPATEGLISAVTSGNPENVFNAVINGMAQITTAVLSNVTDPNVGLVSIALSIRNMIAATLSAPGAAVASLANAASIPAVTAKTITLAAPKADPTATTATAGDTKSTAAGATGPTKSAASGAAGASRSATGSTTPAATDGTTKSSTDATDSSASSATSSTGDTTTKGDTGTKSGTDTGTKSGSDTGTKGDGGAKGDAGKKSGDTGSKSGADGKGSHHHSAAPKHAAK